jgi:PAS domain S-box-containing protein
MGTIRVLHVDDETDFGDLVADCLEREDDAFEVYTETSVDAALDHLFDDGVDCVVSDYDMPGTDGIEFLGLVREYDENLPFILFTGKGSESVASEAFSAGATDYLQKETGTDQFTVLANRVRNYVEEYRAQSRRRSELAAVSAAHDGIAIIETDRFAYVNEAYADLYGYERDEMIGEHWELVYPPDEVELAREEAIPAAREEGRWHGRTTGLRADGSTFPEDHVLARTDSGELVCAVRDASKVDVDAETFRRYETLVESLGDPVYALDDEGRFTGVNDAFLELTGYDRETVIGSTPGLIKDESDVETAERELARLLSADGPDSVTFEIDVQPAAGDPVPVEDHMGVLWDEDGSFAGSVGTLRDVTERVEVRQRLRAEKRLLDRSLDALTDIYYYLDAEGRVQRWNSSLAAVTGYSGEELDGRDALSFFEGEDRERVAEAVSEALETGSARVATDLVTESGRAIPYEFTGARLDDENGDVRGVIGVGRDVTERRAYERRLERKNERLEEFASVVSHDLRNPLNVAQGRLDLLADAVGEDHAEDFEAVGRSLDRMEALIEDLLALAREGESLDETEPVDLADVFDECWRTVDQNGEATLRVETDATVRADRSRLRQLAENLLSNATEHAGTDVTVTVGDTDGGFFVADDGSGIPEDEREQVFESGYSTTRRGTGFGLSIVQSVATAHGWTVDLNESTEGGARFEFGDVASVE